jgi:hypothetical protein
MRPVNRVIAAVLALLLTVAGFLAAIEIVAAAAGRHHSLIVPWHGWYDDAVARQWNDGAVRVVGVVLTIVGVALVLLQLVPRPPRQLRMNAAHTGLTAEVDRRSLQKSLRRTTEQLDGIARSDVRIDRSRLVVRARANRRDTTGLTQVVGEHADSRLQTMDLEQTPTVGVAVTKKDA